MPFFSNVNKPNITNAVNARVWAFQKLESFNFNLGNSQNAQKKASNYARFLIRLNVPIVQ